MKKLTLGLPKCWGTFEPRKEFPWSIATAELPFSVDKKNPNLKILQKKIEKPTFKKKKKTISVPFKTDVFAVIH